MPASRSTPPVVAIIVPPGGNVAYPSLAPASLKGYLERSGVPVALHDLNILGFHDVGSPTSVNGLLARLASKADALRREFADHPDVLHQIDFFGALSPTARAALYDIPARLRSRDVFADERAYTVALQHLALLGDLIELVYFPLRFLPGSILGGMFVRVRDLSALLTTETPYDEVVERALSALDWNSCDIVGLSAFSFDQLVFAVRMARRIRALAPHVATILGGNCLSESEVPPALRAFLLHHFEAVVTGDGELPLLRFVEHVRNGRSLTEVPNAVFLSDGTVQQSALRYKYRFEADSAPDFDGLPMDRYLLPVPVLPFRFSNGCDWGRCTFCSESADRGPISSRRAYAELPAVTVADHLARLRERWGAEIFVNCSSLVTAQGCIDIATAVRSAGLPVQWFAMVRAELAFTAAAIRTCASGGASALNFGIESFHPRVNRAMKKGINLQEVPGILGGFRAAGVTVTTYTMANYPGETLEEFEYHLARLEANIDNTDIVFKSNFMMVTEAPVFAEAAQLRGRRDLERAERLRDDVFPVYLLPDETTGGQEYRWPDDHLEEKLDGYHRMLLRLVARRPMYFDRRLEIASHCRFWEPEYNMIAKQLGSRRMLPGLSLDDLLAGDVALAEDVTVEELGEDCFAITSPERTMCLYYDGIVGTLLCELAAGRTFAEALGCVIEFRKPSADEVLNLYNEVHMRLRELGLLHASVPAAALMP